MTGKVQLGADSDEPALQGLVAESTPNKSVQATINSVRSSLAPAVNRA
jgi:hypothetical protein